MSAGTVSCRRLALVVASDEYDDPRLQRLLAPRHDAEALAEALADPGIGGFDVQTLLNEPASAVAEAVEAFFADRRRDDLLLMYFSGHGVKDDLNRLFFAMRNTRIDRLHATAVSAAFVQERMQQTRARQNVLLLDCCYSGAFGSAATKGDAAVHTADALAASGSVVLTASDSIEYSFEREGVPGESTRSVFTHVLLDGLTTGAADRDGDGDISLDELYDYVHDRVVQERPGQRPSKWAWDLHGRLIIARNPHWTLPGHVTQAVTSPFPAMRLGAVDELTHLLQTGNDTVRERAREALTGLATDDSRSVSEAAAGALAAAAAPGAVPAMPEAPRAASLPGHSAEGSPPGQTSEPLPVEAPGGSSMRLSARNPERPRSRRLRPGLTAFAVVVGLVAVLAAVLTVMVPGDRSGPTAERGTSTPPSASLGPLSPTTVDATSPTPAGEPTRATSTSPSPTRTQGTTTPSAKASSTPVTPSPTTLDQQNTSWDRFQARDESAMRTLEQTVTPKRRYLDRVDLRVRGFGSVSLEILDAQRDSLGSHRRTVEAAETLAEFRFDPPLDVSGERFTLRLTGDPTVLWLLTTESSYAAGISSVDGESEPGDFGFTTYGH